MDTLSIAIAINIVAGEEAKAELHSRCVWCLEKQDPRSEWHVYSIRGGDCGTCQVSGQDVHLVLVPKTDMGSYGATR